MDLSRFFHRPCSMVCHSCHRFWPPCRPLLLQLPVPVPVPMPMKVTVMVKMKVKGFRQAFLEPYMEHLVVSISNGSP